MEIFLKTQHDFKKINWFSSIPEKFKEDIKDQLKKENLDFDQEHTYQIVVNMPKIQGTSLTNGQQTRLNSASVMRNENYSTGGHQARPQTQGGMRMTINKYGMDGLKTQDKLLLRRKMIHSPIFQNIVRTREEKFQQMQQESELNKMYQNAVQSQLQDVGIPQNNIQINTLSVKYLGITDGKIGILSRKVPIPAKIQISQQPINPRVLKKVQSAKVILRPPQLLQDIRRTSESKQTKIDEDEDVVPQAFKPDPRLKVVQGHLNQFISTPQKVEIKETQLAQIQNQMQATQINKLIDDKTNILEQELKDVIGNFKNNQSQSMQTTQRLNTQKAVHKKIESHYKLDQLSQKPNQKVVQEYINQKTFHKIQEQKVKKQYIQKVEQAYQEFNQINQLLPNPHEYNQFLINKYSIPKGLRGYRRVKNQSECEQEFSDRYTKENLERLNLADRRKMLGAFQQSQGLQGSKIKPVIISPKTHQTSIYNSKSKEHFQFLQ
eukprot:403357702